MLQSMTAYGTAEKTIGDLQCTVEIKSLNGKQFDVYAKMPQNLKSIDTKLRHTIKKKLQRGSIELLVHLKQFGDSKPISINNELALFYKEKIKNLSQELNLSDEFNLDTILKLPEVISTSHPQLEEKHLEEIVLLCEEICDKVIIERKKEGDMLEKTLLKNISAIQNITVEIEPLEKERRKQKKDKISAHLKELETEDKFDKNRLEQEIVYYIEKLDISEEQTRLAHHCEYFLELVHSENELIGKKLGFVCQEIGREINTLGAKANNAAIQKLVVSMKDELEQAKEQIANVL
jgi:uncharacterized protein (TIGR00255 family)